MLEDKLKRALLWIYIAQYVKRHVVDGVKYAKGEPAGVYEEDCKRYCSEYEYLVTEYLDISKGHRHGQFVRTTIKGTLEGQRIVNELLSQHNDKLQELLESIPIRLLAFFVKDVFLSSDGLLIKEDYVWGRFDLNQIDYIEHQCLLNDKRVKNRRDEILNKLVELNLTANNVTTYSIGEEKRDIPYPGAGDKVYCIAPEVLDYLKNYVSKNFSENIFSDQLEEIHLKCHPKNTERLEYKVDVNFLNPLVEYLLEEKRTEPVGEPIKPEFPPPEPIQPDVYFQNNTWKVFYNFLATAESSIDICADTITADALSIILHPLQGEAVLKNTRLMARSIQGVEKIIDFGISKNNITQCKKLHAKFIIKDKKALLVTSCNVTLGALGDIGKRPGSYEASIITENKDCVNEAGILFYGIWNEKTDIPDLKVNLPFISSARGIPSKIEDLIKNAKKEIVIAVPPLFEKMTEKRKSIIEYIRGLNPSVPLSIYTNYSVPENSWSSFEALKDQNIKITLVSELLHAKIYLFDDEITFISSLNLSYASWCESVETGLLTKDQNYIKEIKEVLANFKVIDNPVMKKSGDGNGDETFDIEDIRHIEFKFKTEGKKQNLIGKLERTYKPLPDNIVKSSIILNLIGNPIGVRNGGILYVGIKKIKVKHSREQAIQKELSVDISGLKIGDSFYVKDLNLPEYVIVLSSPNEVIATVKKEDTIIPPPKPKPQVKTQGKWRIGRGFSYSELSNSNLQLNQTKKLGIDIDRRRETCHEININVLKKFLKNS